MKDKSKAADQDVFGLIKLLFGTSDQPYHSRSDAGATYLASGERYQLPEVIRRVARSPQHLHRPHAHGRAARPGRAVQHRSAVGRARGVPTTIPAAVPFWWERGAQTAWQAVPQTLATIDQYDLFDTELFKPYKPLVDLTGGDPAAARQLAYSLRCMINVGVLSRGRHDDVAVSADAMLSTAQDYRPGCYGEQYHAWQATLDEDAVVFTTLPGQRAASGHQLGRRRQVLDRHRRHAAIGAAGRRRRSTCTRRSTRRTGRARSRTSPTSPTRTPTSRPSGSTRCARSATGRSGARGNGYVALWSWRPTSWRTHDPSVTFTNGLTQAVRPGRPGWREQRLDRRGRRRGRVGLVRRVRRGRVAARRSR